MRFVRLAYNNWFSRSYLLGVLAVAAWVLVTVAADPTGPNLAGVWLIAATLPFSMLGVLAGVPLALYDGGTAFVQVASYSGIVLGAVANAMLIGLVVQQLGHRSARRLS